jgi:hypothetical protein
MGKAYWHSIGCGALGMTGPWNSPARRDQRDGVWARALIRRAILSTFLLALLVGMAIGVYQDLRWGGSDARETAALAYRSAGLAMNQASTSVITSLSLGEHATATQDNILFYIGIPYQFCAFAGAYLATVGIHLLEVILTAAGLRR